MYSFNYLGRIHDSVENKIFMERMQYNIIYEKIEEYVSKFIKESQHDTIMIGGRMGINLLLEKERTFEDFTYDLYTENAFIHANNLINEIDGIISKEKMEGIVFLKTTIPNMKYQIIINNRTIINFIRLSENSYDLITPVKVKTFNKKHSILVVSPEIQLIDIYRILYSPHDAEEWEDVLRDENKLFNHLQQRIHKIGSAQEIITVEDRKVVELDLFKQFVTDNPNVILIGEHALKMIIGTDVSTSVIQVISQNNIEDDFSEIEKIIKKSLKRNVPVLKFTRDLHVMQDFRIRRTTIKIGDENSQKEVLYIYNSAMYDLIPFNILNNKVLSIQIGNPFVLLRFLLIDFWIIRWIKQIGSIDEHFAKQRLDSILGNIIQLRSTMADKETKKDKSTKVDDKYFDSLANPVLRVFQSSSENYIGFYDNENISQKLIIKDLPKKFYDYYPSEYKRKNGTYRVIQ